MRLLTSFLAILGLVTPVAFVAAVDNTSIPVLVRTWDKECKNEIPNTAGLIMIRSNHHCYDLQYPSENAPIIKTYQSSLDVSTGTFNISQFNIPKDEAKTFGACNETYSADKNYMKSWTNITLRTCVPGLGYSFDWAPVDRYIGYSFYDEQPESNTCDDDLEQATIYGNAIPIGTCVSYANGKRKFLEWANGTISDCILTAEDSCSSNTTCGKTPGLAGAYPLNTCTPIQNEIGETHYKYWVKFGGPIVPIGPAATTTPPTTTATPTTKAPINNATSAPTTTAAPTNKAPTSAPTTKAPVKPNGANLAAHTNIFTIIAIIGVAFVATL